MCIPGCISDVHVETRLPMAVGHCTVVVDVSGKHVVTLSGDFYEKLQHLLTCRREEDGGNPRQTF